MGITCLLFTQNSVAQIISETQWFFGQSTANLQFDKNGQLVYEEERMNASFGTGGPAVASDPYTGNLFFYSDGTRVYDASHTLMPGGNGLSGNPDINQSAVVVPVPLLASADQFFLFTNGSRGATDEIQYARINMSQVGNGNASAPLGQVMFSNTGTGLTNPSEGMIILPSRDPSYYWLLSQNRTTFDFQVTQITATGPGATQTFALDTATTIPGAEAVQFAYNPDSALIAVAPRNANRNILLLNFNDTTGALSVNQQIRNTGFNDSAGESIYDIEWSGNGRRLYLSRYGAADTLVANVYQIDMEDSLLRVVPLINQRLHRCYGIKRAIDDRLYLLYQSRIDSAIQIARFNDIDSVSTLVSVEMPYFNTDFNGTQFPAFADPGLSNNIFVLGFTFEDPFQYYAVKFFPQVSPAPNSYFWDFGDGNTSNAVAPIHEYASPNTYLVTLTVELNGVRQTSAPVVVDYRPVTEELNIGNDTVICVNDPPLVIPQQSIQNATSYLWSTGSTNDTIHVDTTGTYWVEVTFADGTKGFDAIEVTEYGTTRQLANQWYFGEMAGLDFNTIDGLPPPPRAITDANMMSSEEGCASISDQDANLLFYTNGETVWNRNHQPMPNGTNLGGNNTATQGALIIPFMDDITLFYIFTAEEVYGDGSYDIRFAIVDMKEDGANGAVIARDMVLAEKMAEKLSASSFTVASWLTMHGFGNNNFRTHLISDRGLGPVIHTPLGEVLSEQAPEQAGGYMKFSPTGLNFVNVIPGPNQFELFDYNQNTGRLENNRLIETNAPSQLYGVEFSGDGNKLYLSDTTSLMQYDLDSLNRPTEIDDITNSKFTYSASGSFGAIQRGPNGILYIAVNNSPSIPFLSSPNGDDNLAGFTSPGTDLGGSISRKGLPNFVQNISDPPQTPGLTFINACLGQETQFFATGTSVIDTYSWQFDNTASFPTDAGEEVTTIYSTPGEKIVRLAISNRCLTPDSIIFVDTLEVFTIPEQPIFPDEINLCGADSLALELWFEDRADLSFRWEYLDNGVQVIDTSRVLVVYEAIGDVLGAIVNEDGCSADTTFFVGDNRPYLDLGLDQTYCQNTTVADLDGGTTGVTYTWWLDGTLQTNQDTARLQPISTTTAGIYQYVARIRDPFFGCTNQDTLHVTIQEAPAAFGNTTSPTLCGAPDGELNFEITTSGAFLYDISGNNLSDAGTLDGPGTSAQYTGLSRGAFTLDLENLVTGCTSTVPLFIEDDTPFDLTARNIPDCLPDVDLQMTLSGTQLPEYVGIQVTDTSGAIVFEVAETTVPINVYPGLADGLYYVYVTDRNTGCMQADSVLIEPLYADEETCEPVITIPNAFSPNGNGQNEEFFAYPNAFVDKFEIFIYSRWGELVYYSDQKDFRWDGVYNGQVLGPGTMSYVIKFTSLEQPSLGTLKQYGSITIIR